jgi:capsular polysaccharide transport system permease protein
MTSPSLTSSAQQNASLPRPQKPKTRKFKFFRVTSALIMREIASSDSRVSLGFLWQFIEPVGSIAIMTLLFQMMIRTPPLGTNFPLFYVTGLVPFQAFLAVSNKVSSTVRFSRPLLEFPAVSVIDAIAARFILNFVIECAVFVILVAGIIWTFKLQVAINIPLAAESLALAGLLALGIGTFNSVLFLAYPLYETVWGVVTRPLMLISGVIFLVDGLPNSMKAWVMWNPLVHVVSMMRGAFYPGANTSFVSPTYLIMLSLVTLTLGLVTLKRFFRDALER